MNINETVVNIGLNVEGYILSFKIILLCSTSICSLFMIIKHNINYWICNVLFTGDYKELEHVVFFILVSKE